MILRDLVLLCNDVWETIRRRSLTIKLMIVVTFLYLIVGASYIAWISFNNYIRQSRSQIELRLHTLQAELQSQREIAAALAQRLQQPTIFKDLTFDETWADEGQRAAVTRLLEYAAFAAQKQDYQYADRLYGEALAIQRSPSVLYYFGRNAYFQGDFRKTEALWRDAISLDSTGKYPELRFYLAIVLHEMGNRQDAVELMIKYLDYRK